MAAGEMRSLVCTAENRGAAERSRDRTKAAACACEQERAKSLARLRKRDSRQSPRRADM